jgi:hypothetical protein
MMTSQKWNKEVYNKKEAKSINKKNSLPLGGCLQKTEAGYRFRMNNTPAMRAHTPAITAAREKLTPNSIKP